MQAGSWAVTGSAVPGARVVSGVLMFAGPSNTLLALAADSIASSGSQQRPIHKAEYDWANAEVFNYTLPPMDWLWITDTIGGGNRPFTFPQGERECLFLRWLCSCTVHVTPYCICVLFPSVLLFWCLWLFPVLVPCAVPHIVVT